jgi:hypothetical protein
MSTSEEFDNRYNYIMDADLETLGKGPKIKIKPKKIEEREQANKLWNKIKGDLSVPPLPIKPPIS